jgi:hypothetical protein
MGVSPFLHQENGNKSFDNKPFDSETTQSEAKKTDGLEGRRRLILGCDVSYITTMSVRALK